MEKHPSLLCQFNEMGRVGMGGLELTRESFGGFVPVTGRKGS